IPLVRPFTMSRPALLNGSVNHIYARAPASNPIFFTRPEESGVLPVSLPDSGAFTRPRRPGGRGHFRLTRRCRWNRSGGRRYGSGGAQWRPADGGRGARPITLARETRPARGSCRGGPVERRGAGRRSRRRRMPLGIAVGRSTFGTSFRNRDATER